MNLLLVEDNVPLSVRITTHLSSVYAVTVTHTAEDALMHVAKTSFGIVVLDLNLPDRSGLAVCREIRARNLLMPILILTATEDVASCVGLLESGADDYMTKPFDARELRARTDALSRRQPLESVRDRITVSDLVIDTAARTVTRGGVPVILRRKEFDILEYMVRSRGRIVTRDMILSNVWDAGSNSWANTIDVHIKNLRDRIDRPFAGPPLIKTAYGIGYGVEVPEVNTEERKTT